jgi:hypothetical protein
LFRSLLLLLFRLLRLIRLLQSFERQPVRSKEERRALLGRRFLFASSMRNVSRRGRFLDLGPSLLHHEA